MELTAQNTIPRNIVDTILTGQSPSTFLEKINLTTIKMAEISRKNRHLFLFNNCIFASPCAFHFFNKVSSAITFLCVKLVDRSRCHRKRMAKEKKSIKIFRAVAPTILEILLKKEIMLVNFFELTSAGFSNFDLIFINSK